MKIIIVILVIVKCCLADDCTGIPNCFETIPTTIAYEWNIIYPGNFTSTCIANGCPALNQIRSNQCPSNSNTQNVNAVLQTAGCCLTNLMCGVTMDPVPIAEVTFVTQQLLGAFSQFISGSCTLPTGKGFVYNMSTIQTTVTTNSPINNNYPLAINTVIPELLIQGTLGCSFKILSIIPLNLNAVNFAIKITYNSNILETVSKSNTASQIQSSNFQVTSSNFDLGVLGLNIGTIFSSAIQSFLQSSTFAEKINQFLANLYTGALQSALKNCS